MAPIRCVVALLVPLLLLVPTGAAIPDLLHDPGVRCADDGEELGVCGLLPEACVRYDVTLPDGSRRTDLIYPLPGCDDLVVEVGLSVNRSS